MDLHHEQDVEAAQEDRVDVEVKSQASRPLAWTRRNVRQDVGLPPVRLHDLRHGAATLALAAGVEMKVVQTMLRHADITTTTNLYTSVLPEVAHAAAQDIAKFIPRAAREPRGA
jgi:integrase